MVGTTELEITQQNGFKWTICILRQFTHLLSKTIDAWETFKDGEVLYFNLPDSEHFAQAIWGQYLAAIDKDVTELRDLRSSLIHRTELFENMTNSVCGISLEHVGISLTLCSWSRMQHMLKLLLQDYRANSSKLSRSSPS